MFTRNFNRKNVKENNTNIFLLIKTLGYCRFIFSKYSKIQNKHDKRRNAHKGRQINTKGDKPIQRETNQHRLDTTLGDRNAIRVIATNLHISYQPFQNISKIIISIFLIV